MSVKERKQWAENWGVQQFVKRNFSVKFFHAGQVYVLLLLLKQEWKHHKFTLE